MLKQWTHDGFCKVLRKNGYSYSRSKGSHNIYVNSEGKHISVPYHLAAIVAYRLIKENNLQI